MYNLADDLVDRHVREGRGDRVAIAIAVPTNTTLRSADSTLVEHCRRAPGCQLRQRSSMSGAR